MLLQLLFHLQVLKMTFVGRFDIERHSSCKYDKVQIFDGDLQSSNLVRSYCGRRKPKSFTSSGQTLSVRFVSDRSGTRAGFRAYIGAVPARSNGGYSPATTTPAPSTTTPAPSTPRTAEGSTGLYAVSLYI